jgi:hypothetical protein
MNGICVAIVASADATANADLLVYECFVYINAASRPGQHGSLLLPLC